MKRILIAGGTGFVGKELVHTLTEKGYELSVLTRQKITSSHPQIRYFRWNLKEQYIDSESFENVDTIINLTGENIGEKRWTKQRKAEIIDSRVSAIELLYNYVKNNQLDIKTFISSSAVGYYGAITSDLILDENMPNGNDFLAEVCNRWEATAWRFTDFSARVVLLRKGVVLGQGGAYTKMASLARWGINTALGSGKQYFPFINLDDLMRMYCFFLEKEHLQGVFNAVDSQHITMNDFSKQLTDAFGKKNLLPNAPAWLVKILFGEKASMLLEGSKISNEKIKSVGFAV